MEKKTFNPNFTLSKRVVHSFLLLIPLLAFTYMQFIWYVIPRMIEIFSKKYPSNPFNMSDIGLMWVPVIACVIIGMNILLIARINAPLKTYKKGGLIRSLIKGFIRGLIAGLILGLIVGLIGSIIGSLIDGLIGGLAMGITAGLTVGLIMGLIIGFIKEFEKGK